MANDLPYARFRRTAIVEKQTKLNVNSYFIRNSASSTTIHATRADEDYIGVLVTTDKEGADEAFLFLDNVADLDIGDYFTWQSTSYFIYEKVKLVKEQDYKKFKVLECNVLVNDTYPAYFIGTMRSSESNTILNKYFLESKMNPVLILPKNEDIQDNTTIKFVHQAWITEEEDSYTIPGISYFTIRRGKNDVDPIDMAEEGEKDTSFYVNTQIELATEDGYFVCESPKVRIISRAATKVIVKFISVGNYTYNVKNNNEIVTKTIEIKGVI